MKEEGWVCPRCKRSNAPDVKTCECSVIVKDIKYPFPAPSSTIPITDKFIRWTDADLENCMIARFFKDNPKAKSCMISCPCKKCRPSMMLS